VKESNSLATEGAPPPSWLRPPPGFTAHLTGMSLTDLVRLQSLTEASGVFLVVSGERSGILHFSSGQLFHAETREQRGDVAAIEILAWPEGEFIRSERALAGNASVNSPLDVLIAGALGVRGLGPARSAATTGIRRKGEGRALEYGAEASAERAPASHLRDLRAAATPGIAAAPAPRWSSKLPDGRALASALVSPLGDLVEGQGPGAEALATCVAYAGRLCELIAQAMGSGETRALRARYGDSELVIHPHADGHLFGCLVLPDAH
jgi:Domain of unknown function (DUF4388)